MITFEQNWKNDMRIVLLSNQTQKSIQQLILSLKMKKWNLVLKCSTKRIKHSWRFPHVENRARYKNDKISVNETRILCSLLLHIPQTKLILSFTNKTLHAVSINICIKLQELYLFPQTITSSLHKFALPSLLFQQRPIFPSPSPFPTSTNVSFCPQLRHFMHHYPSSNPRSNSV